MNASPQVASTEAEGGGDPEAEVFFASGNRVHRLSTRLDPGSGGSGVLRGAEGMLLPESDSKVRADRFIILYHSLPCDPIFVNRLLDRICCTRDLRPRRYNRLLC